MNEVVPNDSNTNEQLENEIVNFSKSLNINMDEGLAGNNMQFITLIKRCNFLYNRYNVDFRNYEKKDAAWSAIAKVFNVTVPKVLVRWRSLREAYSKHKKEVVVNPCSYKKPLPHIEAMTFVDEYITPRNLNAESNKKAKKVEENNQTTKQVEENGYSENNFNLKLIQEVKMRPVIYKLNLGKTGELKQEAWKEVAKALGCSVYECIMKWKHCKYLYRRDRQQIRKKGSINDLEMFKALTFLNPYCKYPVYEAKLEEETSSSLKDECISFSSFEDESDMIDASHSGESDSLYYNMESQESNDELNAGVKNPEFIDVSTTSAFKQQFEGTNDPQHQATSSAFQNDIEWDEDGLFGKAVSADLRKIKSRKKKMKIKAEIYKIIYENEDSN